MTHDYDNSFNSVFNYLLVIGTIINSCIADAITRGLVCAYVIARGSQRAVYRWVGAYVHQYRVIYKQFLPNNY
jgi:hypothetical protein